MTEYDLSDFICPLSKMKAIKLIEDLDRGETAKIILGDTESLKSVAQELKSRGIKPGFERSAENKFVLTITR
ncbi:MAG: sulfurtransferase TusA family protein [Dehalococcoidales bacterium]